MIYQFEHKKITRCHECPMWDIKGGNEVSIEWCNLQDAQLGYDCTPKENDCPMTIRQIVKHCNECQYCDVQNDACTKNQAGIWIYGTPKKNKCPLVAETAEPGPTD